MILAVIIAAALEVEMRPFHTARLMGASWPPRRVQRRHLHAVHCAEWREVRVYAHERVCVLVVAWDKRTERTWNRKFSHRNR
jgi:hypothetical protein